MKQTYLSNDARKGIRRAGNGKSVPNVIYKELLNRGIVFEKDATKAVPQLTPLGQHYFELLNK